MQWHCHLLLPKFTVPLAPSWLNTFPSAQSCHTQLLERCLECQAVPCMLNSACFCFIAAGQTGLLLEMLLSPPGSLGSCLGCFNLSLPSVTQRNQVLKPVAFIYHCSPLVAPFSLCCSATAPTEIFPLSKSSWNSNHQNKVLIKKVLPKSNQGEMWWCWILQATRKNLNFWLSYVTVFLRGRRGNWDVISKVRK